MLFIDFESGFFDNSWSFSGNNNWIVTSSSSSGGTYSAQSGDISNNQTSTISRTVQVPPFTYINISFDRKISSESIYDYLRFYINNSQQSYWSGSYNWYRYEYSYYTGSSTSLTLKWSYTKDGSVSTYNDCGYIDNIEIVYSR